MTASQFNQACDQAGLITLARYTAICKLIRIKPDARRAAAALCLVDGVRQVDAAMQSGISADTLSKTVRAIRRGIVLANTP